MKVSDRKDRNGPSIVRAPTSPLAAAALSWLHRAGREQSVAENGLVVGHGRFHGGACGNKRRVRARSHTALGHCTRQNIPSLHQKAMRACPACRCQLHRR